MTQPATTSIAPHAATTRDGGCLESLGQTADKQLAAADLQNRQLEAIGFQQRQLDSIWQRLGGANNYLYIERVGKKAAGRMLDGRAWDEVPA